MDKIKLSFGSVKYFFKGNTITAVIKVTIPETLKWVKCLDSYLYIGDNKFTAVGIAVCHPTDQYDKEKGMRIARARAESNAYVRFKEILSKQIKCVDDFELSLIVAKNKSDEYIQHQKDYIESLLDD